MRTPADSSLDTDPVAAHLDRAWELLDRGDVTGAAVAADRAAELAPKDPEVLTLRGAVAAARGDTADALELYEAAAAEDPDYASPLLQSAELQLYTLDDPEAALRLADEALEVCADGDERVDALLLKAAALRAAGDEEGAHAVAVELRDADIEDPGLRVRAALACFDAGDLDAAERHLRAALAADDGLADAHHALGLVCEARGDVDGMRAAWLRCRELDLQAPPPPWHVTPDEFHAMAERAFQSLPEQARARLGNVPILVCDYPSVEVVAEGNDPRMLGFFSGVPYGDKPNVGDAPTGPDCVFLYQRNIESACRDGDDLEHEVYVTLWHETAHFFGLDDDDLERIGLD